MTPVGTPARPRRAPSRARHAALLLGTLALSVSLGGCKKSEPDAIDSARANASAAPSALDRVGPGALIEGEHVMWGFRLPRNLKPVLEFPKSALYEGEASLNQLEEYVRLRVDVRHVEVTSEKSVFPDARIKDGDPKRSYRIELIPTGHKIRMRIEDITSVPAEPGLTPEQRWRKAGIGPNGKPLPNALE